MSSRHTSGHGGPRLPPTPDASEDDYKRNRMASPPLTSAALQSRLQSVNEPIYEEPEQDPTISAVSSPTSMQIVPRRSSVDQTTRTLAHRPPPPQPPPPRRHSTNPRASTHTTEGAVRVSTQYSQSERRYTGSTNGHNFGTTHVMRGASVRQGDQFMGQGPFDERLVRSHTWHENIVEPGGNLEQGNIYGSPSNMRVPRENYGDNHYHGPGRRD